MPASFRFAKCVRCATDVHRGGSFQIAPSGGGYTVKQLYWPETNVLITRFLSPDGVGELRDYMPVGGGGDRDGRPQLIRRVHVVRGEMSFHTDCSPAFNYARDSHSIRIEGAGATFHSEDLSLGLASTVPLARTKHGVTGDFTLAEGQTALFGLRSLPAGADLRTSFTEYEADECFRLTVDYWRRWLGKCTYAGRWREMVHRSALALKLLTYEPTGAIVAAATCSLPEGIGGGRNWDYRYTWIRDAAFTLYGLLRIGFTDEAGNFMKWLEERCHETRLDMPLQIMYGIDGRQSLTEEILGHLDGYRGFKPGSHWKRGARPTATRYLRRTDGLGLPLQQVRRADFLRLLDATTQAC